MQWLFELSAACALSALALIPLAKLFYDPDAHPRAATPQAQS